MQYLIYIHTTINVFNKRIFKLYIMKKEYAVKMNSGEIKDFDTHNAMMEFVIETGWDYIKCMGEKKYVTGDFLKPKENESK